MITQLLQIASGSREKLAHKLSQKEWWILYQQACEQAVVGICFAGIEKLPKEQWPPQALLYEWIGTVETIKAANKQLDRQTAVAWKQLRDAGMDAAVLKGQGIACDSWLLLDNVEI